MPVDNRAHRIEPVTYQNWFIDSDWNGSSTSCCLNQFQISFQHFFLFSKLNKGLVFFGWTYTRKNTPTTYSGSHSAPILDRFHFKMSSDDPKARALCYKIDEFGTFLWFLIF